MKIKEFCDKLLGTSFCNDCNNCPIGDSIREYEQQIIVVNDFKSGYIKGRTEAINKCIEITRNCNWEDSEMLIDLFNEFLMNEGEYTDEN